jgi:HEAT repeat protein
MTHSALFAEHFARLVWLLLNETGNIEAQKAALRGAVTASFDGPVDFSLDEWQLVANGERVPTDVQGAQDLAAQLTGHAVTELLVRQRALPGDLLAVARALAAEPAPGSGGRDITMKLDSLGARTVWVVVEIPLPPESHVRRATNPKGLRIVTPVAGAIVVPDIQPAPSPPPPAIAGMMNDAEIGTYLALGRVRDGKASLAELADRLAKQTTVTGIGNVLDDIATMVETAHGEQRFDAVARGIHVIIAGEQARTDPEEKRAHDLAIRRLNRAPLLRAVARMLANDPADANCAAILARMGADGAEALVEELTTSQSIAERRIFFDALATMKAAIPALTHMLGDPRWYVVRNAADLLGEMHATEADGALGELMRHTDERVRRAAAGALAKLGTNTALRGLHGAMRDSSAQVRLLAAAGLSTRREITASHTLTRALDSEDDDEVQLQIIAALGRIATPDAVQRLIKIAEPASGLFRRKSTATRVAAVEALGEARTAAAREVLATLSRDRDRHVREAALRATAAPVRRAQ